MFHSFIISGNVQGVGFRAYIKNKAESLGLKGFVRNILGGDVEIVVNDSSFVEKLNNLPYSASIRKITKTKFEGKEEFHDFTIKRT